ncbi:MAG TPA: hypothetical protein DCW35_05235, partial [Polynucleobacter sp.]|nr:hypothetical protein [Polynucleobacter sp.]
MNQKTVLHELLSIGISLSSEKDIEQLLENILQTAIRFTNEALMQTQHRLLLSECQMPRQNQHVALEKIVKSKYLAAKSFEVLVGRTTGL